MSYPRLTFRIENAGFLDDGCPLEFTTIGDGFEAGRSPSNDWMLPDPSRHISSRHFEVIFRSGAYYLSDLSTNGTYVFGETSRIPSPMQLFGGERIQVGHYVISVTLSSGVSPNFEIGEPSVELGTRLFETYETQEFIHSDGTAETFRGRNIHTGDKVAIKVFLPGARLDRNFLSALSQLNHDANTRHFIFGFDRKIARNFLVSEWLEGGNLEIHLAKGPIPAADALKLIRRLAEGLAEAHKAGAIHRDLNPANIILPDGTGAQAKIQGFQPTTDNDVGTVLHGRFAGTLDYASPEQLGEFGGEVDARTDIYSLGLIAAAIGRGRPLDMGATVVDAVAARRKVPDISDVDPAIRPVLSRMLEPNPVDRPASMDEVIELLENVGSSLPLDPSPAREPIGAPMNIDPIPSAPPSPRPIDDDWSVGSGIGQPANGRNEAPIQSPPGSPATPWSEPKIRGPVSGGRRGRALFRVPRVMFSEISELAELRLTPKDYISTQLRAELEKSMVGRGKQTDEHEVSHVGSFMCARLLGDPRYFEIASLSSEEQHLRGDETLGWDWRVTPLVEGESSLTLRVTMLATVDGQQHVADAQALHTAIRITVKSAFTRPKRFVRDNWRWMLGGSGIGAAAAIYGLFGG